MVGSEKQVEHADLSKPKLVIKRLPTSTSFAKVMATRKGRALEQQQQQTEGPDTTSSAAGGEEEGFIEAARRGAIRVHFEVRDVHPMRDLQSYIRSI